MLVDLIRRGTTKARWPSPATATTATTTRTDDGQQEEAEWREERAAIMEFDGLLARGDAELFASDRLRRRMERKLQPEVSEFGDDLPLL